MEEGELSEGWVFRSELDEFTGDGYIQWNGADSFSEPRIGLVEYTIEITHPGTYRFNWRSRIGIGDDITEHNDTWLAIPNADAFFATQGTNSVVYPHGSGKTPTPEGAGSGGWFKVYMNTVHNWHWDANTSDNDAHQIYATFNEAGTYTIKISGRSNGHAIDRIVLYHESIEASLAQNLELPSNLCYVDK